MDQTSPESDVWKLLYSDLHDLLTANGKESPYGEEDFWLVDDNWGSRQHKVCVNRIEFLTPQIVDSVKQLLASKYADWAVLFAFEFPDLDVGIPDSGIEVTASEARQHFDRERLRRLFHERFLL